MVRTPGQLARTGGKRNRCGQVAYLLVIIKGAGRVGQLNQNLFFLTAIDMSLVLYQQNPHTNP